MKKLFFLISASLALISCSENSTLFETDSDNENTVAITRGIQNRTYNSLGVSYDATNNYLSTDATKYPVVDIDAYLAKNKNSLIQNPTSSGNTVYYSGSNVVNFISDVKSKNSINIGINPFKISGSGDKNTKIVATSQYSYSRADILKRVKRMYLNADPIALQDYLYPEFVRDLSKYSPDEFVKLYGTHVLLDITIGGSMQFTYRSTIEEYSTTVDKNKSVEAGLKFQIAALSSSKSDQTTTTLSQNNSTWKVWLEYLGGTNGGTSITYDSKAGAPKISIDIASWEKSVNESNAGLISINWNKTYPIYDFIKDPAKKAQIKVAVDKYLKNNTVEMVNVKPLYRLYSSKFRNSFFTSSLGEAKVYIQNISYGWDYGDNVYPGQTPTLGYIYESQQPGTKPLYRLYNNNARNSFLSSSLGEANVYRNYIGYRWDYGDSRFPGQTEILGYIASSESANNKPLYRLYKDNIRNSFMSSSLGEANMYRNRLGYRWDYGDDRYPGQSEILGYVLE